MAAPAVRSWLGTSRSRTVRRTCAGSICAGRFRWSGLTPACRSASARRRHVRQHSLAWFPAVPANWMDSELRRRVRVQGLDRPSPVVCGLGEAHGAKLAEAARELLDTR